MRFNDFKSSLRHFNFKPKELDIIFSFMINLYTDDYDLFIEEFRDYLIQTKKLSKSYVNTLFKGEILHHVAK